MGRTTQRWITDEYYQDHIDDPAVRAQYDAQRREAACEAREHRESVEGWIEGLHRRIDSLTSRRREMSADVDAEISEFRLALVALEAQQRAEREAAFAAEWTAEITAARREAWNAMIKSDEYTVNGKLHFGRVRNWERTQGWCHEDLQRALKLQGMAK